MSDKFGWQKDAMKRAAQRALSAQHGPPKRRRKSKKQNRWLPRISTRMRCPDCNGFNVIAERYAGIMRYRCDTCKQYVKDPIETPILVTGKTFKPLNT